MGETLRLHVVQDFVIEECCTCGVSFAMTTTFYNNAKKHSQASGYDTKCFYCPNGHSQSYIGENEAQKLRHRLRGAQDELAFARKQRDKEQRRTAAVKGHLTRAKKRAAAGTCPCCKRTFAKMSEHLLKQHPDYVEKHRSKA